MITHSAGALLQHTVAALDAHPQLAQVADTLAKTEVKDGMPPTDNGADEEAAESREGAPAAQEAAAAAQESEPSPDQKVVAKFLVSNAAAGSVIGKAGSNIAGGPATCRRDRHRSAVVDIGTCFRHSMSKLILFVLQTTALLWESGGASAGCMACLDM